MTDLFPEVAPRIDGDDSNERYTTRETMRLCTALAAIDWWDLDVAACAEAHHAPDFFTRADNGLVRRWKTRERGRQNIWCNPPFDDLNAWVEKAWSEWDQVDGPAVIAMLIPANRCEQPFWQKHIEPVRDRPWLTHGPGGPDQIGFFTVHFLPGRQKFGVPGNPEGVGQSSPPFGCVLLIWRS